MKDGISKNNLETVRNRISAFDKNRTYCLSAVIMNFYVSIDILTTRGISN